MKFFAVLFILIGIFTATSKAVDDSSEDLIFIVNSENPITIINANDIRDYYFKRKRQWPNGESVRFIDRGNLNPLREKFLKTVLQKSNSDIELFWIGQKLYTGDSAPLRENLESGTVQFVSSFKGAIGYVSTTSVLPEKVKVVKVVRSKED